MAQDEQLEDALLLEEAAADEQGDELLRWAVDEYERHERGPVWYAAAFLIGVGLILYALVTQNFLFAIIIVMFGVIIGLASLRDPGRVLFRATTRGVAVGEMFVPYRELRSFWMVYEPPHVKNLYVEFKSNLTPRLIVPIEEADPLKVRETLLAYLQEDSRTEEPLSDLFGRVLKL